MSDTKLRLSIIRLAHTNPDLRPHLLPLLTKTASDSILGYVIPRDEMEAAYDRLEAADEMSANLMVQVYQTLGKRLALTSGEMEAVSRIRDVVTRGKNWDAGLLRNNIFKAANALGLKLPSGSF
jgi:hypothetical protein